jgi:hypothetical protein
LAAALATLIALAVPAAEAQTQRRVLYVSALDAQGQPVTSLAPEDLRIREDGVAREILQVGRPEEPLHLALLVDTSEAMTRYVQDFRTALKAFVARFPAPHQLAYITLGERPTIVTEYSPGPNAVAREVDRLFARPGAGAYVLDAIGDAARGLQKREAARGVIVVLAASGVEFSNRSYEPVLEALEASGAALWVVTVQEGGGTVADIRNQEYRNREIVYDRGTRESGGRHEILLSPMAATEAMTKLADRLLAQFAVTYARPTTLIPPEKVTVEAVRPGLDVRGTPARTGSKTDSRTPPGGEPLGERR